MATRRYLKHQDDVRAKIKTAKLLQRLEKHVDGTAPLDQSQVKAIEIMLKKAMPDLSAVEMTQHEDIPSEQDIMKSIKSLIDGNPQLKQRLAQELNAELAQSSQSVSVLEDGKEVDSRTLTTSTDEISTLPDVDAA